MSNITKLYAAYKAGYLGNNILDTYFSFMANMIIEGTFDRSGRYSYSD